VYESLVFQFFYMFPDALRQFLASRHISVLFFSPGFHRMDIPPFRVSFSLFSMLGIIDSW